MELKFTSKQSFPMLGHWKVARTVLVKLSSSCTIGANSKQSVSMESLWIYGKYLVDVDASAADAQPHRSGSVDIRRGSQQGLGRSGRPLQRGCFIRRAFSRCHLGALGRSIQRPYFGRAIHGRSREDGLGSLAAALAGSRVFLGAAEAIEVQSVVGDSAGCLLNVQQLGRSGG